LIFDGGEGAQQSEAENVVEQALDGQHLLDGRLPLVKLPEGRAETQAAPR
jgi:hypothetical protein